MHHKSILKVFAGLFSLGIVFSILTFFTPYIYYPEIIFSSIFVFLIIACILFFARENTLVAKNKKPGYVKVMGPNVIFAGDKISPKRKNLFLKVSIIMLTGIFRKK